MGVPENIAAYRTAAQTAITAGDWAAAETALSNLLVELGSAGDHQFGGTVNIRFQTQWATEMLDKVRANRAAAAGIGSSKIRWAAPSD